MRAVGFHQFGGAEQIEILDCPVPEPGPGEVLVRVAAATVNPTDLMMLSGAQVSFMTGLTPPFIPGMEFSGVVDGVGPGVSLPLGIPVFGVVNPRRQRGGSHAQYVVVPVESVARLSHGIDLVQAAAVPMNGLTVLLALGLLGLSEGQSLLVTGGTGILGGFAIRLGQLAGLRVLAGGRQEDRDLLSELGAETILPKQDGLVEAVHDILPDGVDGLIDGALIGNTISAAVRTGGGAVSLRLSHPITDPRLKTSVVSVISGLHRHDLLERLATLLDEARIKPRIASYGIYRYTDAAIAFRRAIAGGFRGRIVLDFQD